MKQQTNKPQLDINKEDLIQLGAYPVPKKYRERISKEIQFGSIAPGRLIEFLQQSIN